MLISETIKQLHAARAAHKAWVARAEALVAGLPLDENHVPIVATECDFGKWYYDTGRSLQGFSEFDGIEKEHDSLHQVYAQIFKLLFAEPDSTLTRMFGKTKGQKKADLEQAELLLVDLQGHYKMIVTMLETLEEYLLKRNVANERLHRKEQEESVSHDVSQMMEDLEKDLDGWLKK